VAEENWKRSARLLGLVMLTMETFALELIRSARKSGALDDAELARIQEGSVIALKNSYSTGGDVSIEEEWEIVTRAVEEFRKLSDGTIIQGRK
jgi:hypothetical protein